MAPEENAPNSLDGKYDNWEGVWAGGSDGGVVERGEDETAQIPRSHIEKELSRIDYDPRNDREEASEGQVTTGLPYQLNGVYQEIFVSLIYSRRRMAEENGIPWLPTPIKTYNIGKVI